MANKIVDKVRRTGHSASSMRQLVVVQGDGKDEVETVLTTPIHKVEWGLQFRHGGARTPVEQYAFRVGAKTYARFADAASVVLRKHHIELATLEGAQIYVKKAFAIINGTEPLRMAEDVPTGAKMAGVAN